MRKDGLESFGKTINDLDDNMPKGRGRCFDIGQWGGCGVECPAFQDGECKLEDPNDWKGWKKEMTDNGDEDLIQDMIEFYPALSKFD